jgi:hypothetical protein
MRGNSLPTLAAPKPEIDRDPLPLGDCIFVILIANGLCYGLGYAVFAGVRTRSVTWRSTVSRYSARSKMRNRRMGRAPNSSIPWMA